MSVSQLGQVRPPLLLLFGNQGPPAMVYAAGPRVGTEEKTGTPGKVSKRR